MGELSQPGEPLYQIEASNDGLITFPGGVPIRDGDGNVIGAIGVSGSTVDDDHEVAMAGLGAVQPEAARGRGRRPTDTHPTKAASLYSPETPSDCVSAKASGTLRTGPSHGRDLAPARPSMSRRDGSDESR